MLLVEGDKATLLGSTGARLFTRYPPHTDSHTLTHKGLTCCCPFRGKPSVEFDPGSDLSFLLTQ